MAFIVIDKDNSKEQMRSNMREEMRRGYRGYRGYGGGNYRDEHSYREGYKHGYEDGMDDESDEHYRRSRDSRGRYM